MRKSRINHAVAAKRARNKSKVKGEQTVKRIFKNLKPYKKFVALIFVLLIVQAYCDLALPQYTSAIIDTGIQNSGITHILPEKITETEYGEAQIFMTDKEKSKWQNAYKQEGDLYVLKAEEDELDKLDEELLVPIVLTNQLGHMTVNQFKEIVKDTMKQNPQTAPMADKIDDYSLADLERLMNFDVTSFEAENEKGKTITYVDMRPMMMAKINDGTMSEDLIKDSRANLEKSIEKVGSETMTSMGISYAKSCSAEAGINVDSVQKAYLWKSGFRMFLMAALMFVVAAAVSYLASVVGAGVGRDMRASVFKNVVGFSNSEIDQFSTASLITRSTNDVQQVQMVTVVMLRMILYAPIIGLGGIYKVAATKANMGWVIALGIATIMAVMMTLMKLAMPKFKKMQDLVDRMNLVSREILTGLPVIRAFGQEKAEEARFDDANKDLKKTQLFTNRVMTFMMPSMMLIMYCLVIAITWVGAHRIDTGNLQVGAMTAFIMYSMQIVMAFIMITAMSIMLPRAGVAASRIDEVIRTQSSIMDKEETVKVDAPKGVLEFKNVSFRYPGAEADVLENISFKAEPGKVTAIIGSTGSGKSTLVNLIPRFYDVTGGEITVDGTDIRDMKMSDLRDMIGFVPQKGVLFSGTIASNLRFGKKDASDSEIVEAARIAQAEEFIENKNEKYESPIAQGGSNVSGGQKQRLAIARAIAKNPKIYVFDDSFSALDMKTDANLRKALSDHVKNATEIIVAQRISTILHADNILVIDDGMIVGAGTHEELLKSCDVYRQIAKSQMSAKELGIGGEDDE